MTARVVVATDWDARLLATRDITPAHSHAGVLTWEDFPDVDGGVPRQIAPVLARAMTLMGEVCFRTATDVPPRARLVGKVRSSHLPLVRAWNVVASRDPTTVLALFETGWAEGDQTALVGALTDDRAQHVLGLKRLTDLVLEPEELTVSAIVDGAGMLIAAYDAARLERALACVEQQCRDATIALCGSLAD